MQVNFSTSRSSNVPGTEKVIKQMLTMMQNQLVGLIIFSSCYLSSITTTKHVHDVQTSLLFSGDVYSNMTTTFTGLHSPVSELIPTSLNILIKIFIKFVGLLPRALNVALFKFSVP